jgi:hypothetical protein
MIVVNPYGPIVQAWTNPLFEPNPLCNLTFEVKKLSLESSTRQKEEVLSEKSIATQK